jgi:hypothetical protein
MRFANGETTTPIDRSVISCVTDRRCEDEFAADSPSPLSRLTGGCSGSLFFCCCRSLRAVLSRISARIRPVRSSWRSRWTLSSCRRFKCLVRANVARAVTADAAAIVAAETCGPVSRLPLVEADMGRWRCRDDVVQPQGQACHHHGDCEKRRSSAAQKTVYINRHILTLCRHNLTMVIDSSVRRPTFAPKCHFFRKPKSLPRCGAGDGPARGEECRRSRKRLIETPGFVVVARPNRPLVLEGTQRKNRSEHPLREGPAAGQHRASCLDQSSTADVTTSQQAKCGRSICFLLN